MIATMMPKPIALDNGSGMHVNVSLWNKGKNLFYDPNDKYAELSQTAGILLVEYWITQRLWQPSLHPLQIL